MVWIGTVFLGLL